MMQYRHHMIGWYNYRHIHGHTPWDPDTCLEHDWSFHNPYVSVSFWIPLEILMFGGSKTNRVCLWLFASIPKWSDEIWADAKEGGGRERGIVNGILGWIATGRCCAKPLVWAESWFQSETWSWIRSGARWAANNGWILLIFNRGCARLHGEPIRDYLLAAENILQDELNWVLMS